MRLTSSKTGWFIVCPSASESEKRHVYDLAFTVFCLEAANIPQVDIEVFIDGNDTILYQSILREASPIDRTIYTSSHLFARIQNKTSFENLVIIFTGHGNSEGISASVPIKPAPLVSTLKSAAHLKYVVLVFGQCYAGVFNYVNAKADANNGEPELVLIGATNFCSSLSVPISGQFLREQRPWSANTFLATLSYWFRNPIDVDGDGKFTIVDAFKYAAAQAHQIDDNGRVGVFRDLLELHAELRELNRALGQQIPAQNLPVTPPPGDLSVQLPASAFFGLLMRKKIIEDEIHAKTSIRFVHQEPWILNAWVAQKIYF